MPDSARTETHVQPGAWLAPLLLGVCLGACGMFMLLRGGKRRRSRFKEKRISQETDRLDKVIAVHTRAIEFNAGDCEALRGRAVAYWLQGDLDRAIADFTSALALDPSDAWTYACRGDAYRQNGDLASSVTDCTTAIRLNPADAAVYYCRALAYQEQGCFDKAQEDFVMAKRLAKPLQ